MPIRIKISQYLLDMNYFVAVVKTEAIAESVPILALLAG